MAKNFRDGMKDFEMREGMQGRLKMALAAGVGERMIRRYVDGLSKPSHDQAFRIAKSWGASDGEAKRVANEFASPRNQQSA